MSKKFKRNLSSTYYDAGSFSSLASQTTLTDINQKKSPGDPSDSIQEQQQQQITAENTVENASTTSEAPLPFQPSLWRAPTSNNTRSVTTPDLERGVSTKSNYFMDDSITSRPPAIYNSSLTRDNSIATAISMRRADIMVSRDNPQHLHQHRLSGVLNSSPAEDEVTTSTMIDSSNNNHHSHHHAVAEKDELLYEKKKSIIILLGRLLLKCGCPCHRVVSNIIK